MIDDGRHLDPEIADTHGEAATVRVTRPSEAWPVPAGADTEHAVASDTYYDLPVVKHAPWKGYVPTYFYLGGLAGASATLALVSPPRLAKRLHWIAALGEAAGSVCLIADLGRPSRFHHMMRVVRPSSPMNVGTWILSAAGLSSGLALLGSRTAAVVSALSGSMLSTYTGVLIGNTATPIWAATRRHLPLWFAATSAASLASLLELFGGAPRTYSIAAKSAEVATLATVESAARIAGVARPLGGRMWRGAKWLGIASLAATVLRRPRLAGALGTAAGVLARFAIVEAGRASASDPRATFEPQRYAR